ncbi:MAG: hypothetical protein A3K19_27140 [Lentisphaerae bacterium RIFOXYB12_FULL_65_16]|nr:MAG: hypothetical protein A3K18_09800 [Lentisphaerae bacterium RIFOXYA12_64_32]OGV87688.1 MAG: hypothetical protein A3K19_27140 [Lentisphaerae bacterium RIFOXYB12_FULL_65_16]
MELQPALILGRASTTFQVVAGVDVPRSMVIRVFNMQATALPEELSEKVRALVDQYRLTCLWFLRADYYPTTTESVLRVLGHIRSHGDRAGFVRAKELEQWLSQHSNAMPAES